MRKYGVMVRVCSLFFVALLGAYMPAAGVKKEFYVAPLPVGNDANAGTLQAPFATLEHARQAVRKSLQEGVPADVTVYFRGGRYEMAGPVVFDARDSVQAGGRIVYTAYGDEKPVFSGGTKVSGWQEGDVGVWYAEVGRNVDFRQLWVNGVRAVRARVPNQGYFYTLSKERLADGLALPAGALSESMVKSGDVEISVMVAWMHKRLRIAKTYQKDGDDIAVINPTEWDAVCNQPQGDRVYKGRLFWLENAKAFLDDPGEFYLDRKAGVLYYLPRKGENLRSATVVRPVAESLIRLEGSLAEPVSGLVFSGLTFCETGWTRPNRAGFVDVQANSLVPENIAGARDEQYRHSQRKDRIPGALHAAAAENVRVEDCVFERLGGTAILFVTGQGLRIQSNTIQDVAGGGIELGNDAFAPRDPRLIPDACIIHGNRITRVGQDYFGSVAILGYYTSRALVSHNEITDCPYTAISWGWGWGKQSEPAQVGQNRIIGNKIQNIMQMVDDGGAVYLVGKQPGSEAAWNDISDMAVRDTNVAIGGALYPDQATQGYWIHDNVARGVVKWLHLWTDSIQDNRITDNFADTTAGRNDGKNNIVEQPELIDGDENAVLPKRAQAIIDQAGLQK